MKRIKVGRYILVGSIFAVIGMLLTYGYQCWNLYLDMCGIAPEVLALLNILCGLPLLIYEGIFLGINRIFRWYNTAEIFKIITLGMFFYVILMLVVFCQIPIPYELIPSRELAADYGQFLTQIFTIATAVFSGMVSGIVYLMKRNTLPKREID